MGNARRSIVGAALLSAFFSAPILLGAGPSTAPAGDGPDTAPPPELRAANAPQAALGKVLVLPFTPLKSGESEGWIGRSLQQSLVSDLLMIAPDHVASNETPVETSEAAQAAGVKAGARYVVFGNYQTTPASAVRVTGQILDVQSGQPVAGLKATGTTSDIFTLEDALATQVRQRVFPRSQPPIARYSYDPNRQVQIGSNESATAPSETYNSTGYAYPYAQTYQYQPDYATGTYQSYTSPYVYSAPYAYDYPYDYAYPYWYPSSFFFFGGFDGGFHHHDGDGHHGDFHNGGGFRGGVGAGQGRGGFGGGSGFHGGGGFHSAGGGMHGGGGGHR